MNKAIKERWIEALRSNKYTQTWCVSPEVCGLYSGGKRYCVLGILCDLYLKEHNLSWIKDEDGDYTCIGEAYTIPIQVRDWAELEMEHEDKLVTFSEELKLTFNALADWIEERC